VAEQFAFEQSGRYRRTVELYERFIPARAGIVNRARDQFFTGAGFAEDKYRRIGFGNGTNLIEHLD
jgi:hypothetical protein